MRRFLFSIILLSLSPLSFSQILTPDNISGLKFWITSDSVISTGGFVNGVYDRSGMGNHVYQNYTNARPLLIDSVVSLNHYPAIRFDGVNDYLISGAELDLGNVGSSVFIVAKLYTHTNYGMFVCYGVNNSGSWNFRLRPSEPKMTFINGANNTGAGLSNTNSVDLTSSGFTILYGSVNVASEKWKVSENGVFKDSVVSSFSQANSNYLTIGFRNDGIAYINADIAEIIIFNRELNNEEHSQIIDYLRNRYAPPVELGPPVKLVCDTSITLSVPEYFTQVIWSTGSTANSITINSLDTISVQATDVFGFVSKDTIILKAFQNPISFNIITDTLTCGESITWDPGLDSSLYSFMWSTGDTSPVYKISNSGLYSVVVTDSAGCSASSPSVYAFIDNFSSIFTLGNDTSLCSGETISVIPNNTNIINYLWHNNSTDSFNIISNSGDYWVRVTNNNGCTATDTINITIKGVVPSVDFIFSNGCEESNLLFYDNSIVNDTGHIVSRIWEWGDGNPFSYGDSVFHKYNSNGTYSVTLYINTSTGCTASYKQNVTIFPRPHSDFGYYSTNNPLTIYLFENTIDFGFPINSRIWKYNNSIISLSSFYNYTFPDYGNYSVELIATNNQGCSDTTIKTVSVTSTPIINVEPNNISGLKLWLRPDSMLITDSFEKVSQWHDISGNNYSVIQDNLLFQPQYINHVPFLNNRPVVRFDGIDDGLISNSKIGLGGQGATVFMVKKLFNHTNYGMSMCYGINDAGDWNFRLRPTEPKISFVNANNNIGAGLTNLNSLDLVNSNYTILCGTVNTLNNKWKIIENNIVKDSVYTNFDQADENFVTIAYRNDGVAFINADISEIILYNRELINEEQNQIINYLRKRYAPPVELGPPVVFVCDTSITLGVPDYFLHVLWSTGDTVDSITITQPDTITVQVTDVFGFVSTDTIILKSFQNKFNFNIISDTISCGEHIVWDTGLDSANYFFLWNTGQTSSSLDINNTGNYSVTVTDLTGCPIKSSVVSVFFDPISLHIFLGPDISLCSGNSLSLISGSNEVVSYLWSPGGQTSPLIVLDTSGTYSVTVTSANSCTATDSIYINIQGIAPVASFTTANPCFGDSLVLTDASYSLDQSNVVGWEWEFHDGQTAGDSVVKKKYPAPGIYPVTLTVTTDSACSSSSTLQVQVHHLPEPAFEWSNPCSDKPIQFINTSQVQGGAQISDYLWIVNGTDSFDVAAPLYYANGPGMIPVYLSATSSYGCTNATDRIMEVKVSPVAQFEISPSCTYRKTYFFDQSVAPVYHPIIQWDWDLGISGVSSSYQNPEYTYYQPGNYTVSLNVKSLNGCSDEYVRQIQVSSSPVAGFSGNEGCAGTPLLLTDSSTVVNGYVFSRKWTIENAGTFSDSLVNLLFTDSGHYTLTLEVVSELNCKAETTGVITIHPLPVADFTVSSGLGSAPLEVTFINQSDEGTCWWDFGDGETSLLFNPVHIFTDTGYFSVNLMITDSNGCVKSAMQGIRVVPSLYDIAILGMDTIVNGNIRNIAVILANIGTLPVENPYIVVNLPNSQPFTETVNLTLQPGAIHYYIMTTGILANDIIDRSFICAKIILPALYGPEENQSNNEYCLASPGDFRILRIYPNPASNQLVIEVSSENNGQAEMIIQSPAGSRVTTEEIKVSKGLNRIYLDISNYAQGMYFVSFTYKDEKVFGKFVKSGGTK